MQIMNTVYGPHVGSRELARVLGLSPATLRSWQRRGIKTGLVSRLIGQRMYYTLESVQQYLREHARAEERGWLYVGEDDAKAQRLRELSEATGLPVPVLVDRLVEEASADVAFVNSLYPRSESEKERA